MDDERQGLRRPAAPRASIVDLGMIFDLVNFRPGTLSGRPRRRHQHDRRLQRPHDRDLGSDPEPDGQPHRADGRVGSERDRRACGRRRGGCATTTLSSDGARPSVSGDWVQVSRLGNPLINEVVIPLAAEGSLQRDLPRATTGEVRHVRPQLRARRHPERALRHQRARRRRATTCSRSSRASPGLTQRPGEVISDQLRLNVGDLSDADLRGRTGWACSRATLAASRTAGGPMTTRRHRAARRRGRPRTRLQHLAEQRRSATASTVRTSPSSPGSRISATPHSGFDHATTTCRCNPVRDASVTT